MNYDRIFIGRTTILLATTLALQWVVSHQTAYIVIHVMLYLTVLLMGPISAAMIALLSPWLCYHRAFVVPAISSLIPYMIVGNLCLIIVFYGILHTGSRTWHRHALAIFLSAIMRYIVIHLPAATYMHLPPPIETQWFQIVLAMGSGLLAWILARLLQRWGIQDYYTLKQKGTLS